LARWLCSARVALTMGSISKPWITQSI